MRMSAGNQEMLHVGAGMELETATKGVLQVADLELTRMLMFEVFAEVQLEMLE